MNTMPLAADKAESVALKLVNVPVNEQTRTYLALYNLARWQRNRANQCRSMAANAARAERMQDYLNHLNEASRQRENAKFSLFHARWWKTLGGGYGA